MCREVSTEGDREGDDMKVFVPGVWILEKDEYVPEGFVTLGWQYVLDEFAEPRKVWLCKKA